MTNFIKQLPEWKSKGIEPPQGLRDTGWKVAQRPPAAFLDWFFNRTYESLKELQENAAGKNSLGDLSKLTTTEKITLVGAINEINEILKINQSPHRAAINVSIKDDGGYFTKENVEDSLQEVGLGLKNTNQTLTDLAKKQGEDVTLLDQKITTNENTITDLTTKTADNTKKIDEISESLSKYRTTKDDNGIYRKIEWRNKGGVLKKQSIITVHPTTGDYDKQTVITYGDDGITVTKKDVYNLMLDGDGDIVNEVLQ